MLTSWCLCISLQPEKKTEEDTASGSSPAVFVSVLVTGLLLAALIVGIYYFKCHRRSNGKGMKLVSPQINGRITVISLLIVTSLIATPSESLKQI